MQRLWLVMAMSIWLHCGPAWAVSFNTAHLRREAEWYATAEAKGIAENVLSHQADSGMWPKNIDTSATKFNGDRKTLVGTFDNAATTDEIRFMAKMFNANQDARYRDASLKGLNFIRQAQYPNGGWPQTYPPPKSYHRHITFNDDAMVRMMILLREVKTSKTFEFAGEEIRNDCQQRFDKGIECILKCQVKVDGKLTAWCAQHDEIDLSPRPARTFELISLSGSESVGLVRLLMSLDKPSPEVIAAVDGAVAWFEAVQIKGIKLETKSVADAPGGRDRVVVSDPAAPPMWARFYEIGTNVPIYTGRDGVKKATLAEIDHERRNGYAWLGNWPARLLTTDYPAWKQRVGRP